MKDILKKIFRIRTEYKPLIEVRVFKNAILHNLKQFQNKYPKLKFVPVLKSNAYGHGLVQVAKILDHENLPFVMVDSFFEALQLKREGIKTKILILGYSRLSETVGGKLSNVSFGIIDLEQLRQIVCVLKKPQTFHLKIDTGMHRQGIMENEINEAIKLIKQNKNFILEGLCSHFASADENEEFTNKQIKLWNKVAKKFKQEFLNQEKGSFGCTQDDTGKSLKTSIKYFHVSNTAGSFFADKLDVNVGRIGIGLFGINQSNFEKLNLQPALEMVSIISSIKKLEVREKIGYGTTYETQKETIVATVPVGYNEGVDRRLSNIGVFKIAGVDCPIVGRVSMNMSSVDISEIRNQKLEQEVQIISPNTTDKNSVESMAKLAGCIPYEILVHIPSYLKRTII